MCISVAPHVGAWIETAQNVLQQSVYWSLPMWERGLKLPSPYDNKLDTNVAPHVGAWIETYCFFYYLCRQTVAPHVGAWIETTDVIINLILIGRSPCGSVD